MTLIFGTSNDISAQFLHTPKEIEDILSKSPQKYIFLDEVTSPTYDFKTCSIKENIKSATTKKTRMAWSCEDFVLKNEKVKSPKRKIKKTLKELKGHKLKDLSFAYQRLAKWYFLVNNYDQAIYYKKLEQESRNNSFQGKLFLAVCYYKLKKFDIALDLIVEAKILNVCCSNKSNPDFQAKFDQMLSQILESNQLRYDDWSLHPQYCIQNNNGVYSLSYSSEVWKTYASCKMVWMGEAGYAEKMKTISNQPLLMVEEKESILNALTIYLRTEDKSNIEYFKFVAEALDQMYIDELIIYELYLAHNKWYPYFNHESKDLEKIKKYFLMAHCLPIN